jgi:hypothetical protein
VPRSYGGTGRNACATELQIQDVGVAEAGVVKVAGGHRAAAVVPCPDGAGDIDAAFGDAVAGASGEQRDDGALVRVWAATTVSPVGESLALGRRYRWCSRRAPVLLHWVWKTARLRRGKCETYEVPCKMVRSSCSLKPRYYFAGFRFSVHLYQRGARQAAIPDEATRDF